MVGVRNRAKLVLFIWRGLCCCSWKLLSWRPFKSALHAPFVTLCDALRPDSLHAWKIYLNYMCFFPLLSSPSNLADMVYEGITHYVLASKKNQKKSTNSRIQLVMNFILCTRAGIMSSHTVPSPPPPFRYLPFVNATQTWYSWVSWVTKKNSQKGEKLKEKN